MEFHETGYARPLFERQLPQLIKALERLATAAERLAPAPAPAAQPRAGLPDYMAVINDVYRTHTPQHPDERIVAAWKAGVACGVTALYDRVMQQRCPECGGTVDAHEATCSQGRD